MPAFVQKPAPAFKAIACVGDSQFDEEYSLEKLKGKWWVSTRFDGLPCLRETFRARPFANRDMLVLFLTILRGRLYRTGCRRFSG